MFNVENSDDHETHSRSDQKRCKIPSLSVLMLSQLRTFALKRPLSRPTCLRSRSYTNSGPRSGPKGPLNTQNQSNSEEKDFRSPWVYSGSHILTYTLIPSVGLYCVFLADWGGQEDHVFMPPRRWLARQRAAFFSLSPAEQELAKSDEDHEKRQ